MASFDSVHTTTCSHFAAALQNQVNLFFAFVVVGEVGAPGSYFHNEKASQDSSCRNAIAFAVDISHEQAIKSRRGISADRLCADIVDVGLQRLARQRGFLESSCAETHDDDSQGRPRSVTKRMRNGRWNIQIVVLAQSNILVSIFDKAAAFEHHVHLIFFRIFAARAGTVWIDHDFAITSYADSNRRVRISFTKERFVVTRGSGNIGGGVFHRGNVAMEESRVYLAMSRMQGDGTKKARKDSTAGSEVIGV